MLSETLHIRHAIKHMCMTSRKRSSEKKMFVAFASVADFTVRLIDFCSYEFVFVSDIHLTYLLYYSHA